MKKLRDFVSSLVALMALCFAGAAYAVPGRITTLNVVASTSNSVTLSFTMPAPGAGLTLTAVECRKSEGVNFLAQTYLQKPVVANPAPAPVGTVVRFTVAATPGVTTWYACKAKDTTWALMMSNTVSVATSVPIVIDAVLAWDPITSERLTGFVGYWREKTGGVYDTNNKFDLAGNVSTYTVKVPYGLLWCFVLYAVYDNGTLILGPSNEACKASATQ